MNRFWEALVQSNFLKDFWDFEFAPSSAWALSVSLTAHQRMLDQHHHHHSIFASKSLDARAWTKEPHVHTTAPECTSITRAADTLHVILFRAHIGNCFIIIRSTLQRNMNPPPRKTSVYFRTEMWFHDELLSLNVIYEAQNSRPQRGWTTRCLAGGLAN